MSPIVFTLITANVLMSFKGFNDRYFFERYKFQVGPINGGERIRLLSSAFLHVDVTHLLFNMLTLYFFADVVLWGVGPLNFILIYAVSLFAGNWFSLKRHQNQPLYSAVGASGAVMGVLYAAIMLMPHMGLYLFFIPIPIPAWLFGILYLLYSIYGMKKGVGNIGHSAHLGGAIGGYVITILLAPKVLSTNLFLVLILGILIVLFILFEKRLKL